MNDDDLEKQLRSALRSVDPREGFAQRVVSRIESASAPRRMAKFPQLFAALAASVVLSIVVVHEWQAARREKGLEARRQLIEALRMTGEKLDLAYHIVNGEPQREKPSS
jgi:hypothetical protein